ncbi:hypothetical protein [Pendulispora albinea]|uniref:Uncharacterized protein n=1 Tax=Pendulispora albinea TaxID=2741071 RepID=A0ABZ2LSR1_9BACT
MDLSANSPERDRAALAALPTLRKLAREPGTVALTSLDLDGATLGEAIPMRMVRLDTLRGYRAGDSPQGLLVDMGTFFYPVIAGGEVRTGMVVRRRKGKWVPSVFGQANLAKAAHDTRNQLAKSRSAKSVVLAEIPALQQLRFLAHEENGELLLTPVEDLSPTLSNAPSLQANLAPGKPESAADVFAQLVPLAERTPDSIP